MKRKITHEEDKLITDSFKDATPKELLTLMWWEFTNSKKIYKFIDGLVMGKSFRYAFSEAKNKINGKI